MLKKIILKWLEIDSINNQIDYMREELNKIEKFKEKLEHDEDVSLHCKEKCNEKAAFAICKHGRIYINKIKPIKSNVEKGVFISKDDEVQFWAE